MAVDYVFKKKKIEIAKGLPVYYLLGEDKKVQNGDIGIEIEVEGNKFQKKTIPAPWIYTKDGSLRGIDNAEYVLSKPIKFERVPEALKVLWGMFDSYGSVLDESNRTSVHVHLNVQQFHLNRLCSFFALYFLVEELLTAWCGDHRIGNLFCLRAKDAPAIISEIKAMLRSEKIYFNDGMHYGGLNAGALNKFGSVEIRSLRGVNDPKIIEDWISVLERIYNLSAEFPDPRAIPEGFSGNGPIAYAQNLLGDKYHTIVDNIGYSQNEIMEALYDGIRLTQDLCYCRDWSLYQPVTVKGDPFGRTPAKVKKSLATAKTVSTFDGETMPTGGSFTVKLKSLTPSSSGLMALGSDWETQQWIVSPTTGAGEPGTLNHIDPVEDDLADDVDDFFDDMGDIEEEDPDDLL